MPSLSNRRFTALGLLALLIGLGIWALIRPPRNTNSTAQNASSASEGAPIVSPSPSDPATTTKSGGHPGSPSAFASEFAALQDRYVALSAAASPEEARRLLGELRAWLKSLPAEQAAALIARFMDGKEDASLPLEFSIGEGGFLDTPPTFRVALLDFLGFLHPQAAADLGRQILRAPTTGDEWAIALRNIGRLQRDKDANAYLREKTEELIRNEAWQEHPSVGFLNAFDVLVHTRATESTPLLSTLIQQKSRRDLAHAGFLTLDRLTQREPVEILHRLREDRALQESRPEMVAQQFARADLRQPAQRELVRAWLLDPNRNSLELQAFSGVFPNNNQMISRNLLTTETQLSGSDLLAHDRAVLEIISEWQQDPAFQAIQPHLATMTNRLRQFTSPGPAPAGVSPNP